MCSPDPPDCGLLRDKLSLTWGDYKDKVDELTMEMNTNVFVFEKLKITLSAQIQNLQQNLWQVLMSLCQKVSCQLHSAARLTE